MGVKVIYARFSDDVGNWSNAVSDQITFESGIPTIEINKAGGTYQGLQTITLTSSDNDGQAIEFDLDNTGYQTYTGALIIRHSQNLKYKTTNQFSTDSVVYNQDYIIQVAGLYNMELVEKSDMITEVTGSVSFVVKDMSDSVVTSGVMIDNEINLNSSNNLEIGQDYVLNIVSNDNRYFDRNFTFKVDYLSVGSTDLKTYLKVDPTTYSQIDNIWLMRKVGFQVVSFGDEVNLVGVTVNF